MRNTTDPRKYVPEMGKTIPETDETATYLVRNRTSGPITIQIANDARTSMQSLPLGGRPSGEAKVPGHRMTDLVWELESQGLIEVTKIAER